MKFSVFLLIFAILTLLFFSCSPRDTSSLNIPLDYYKLSNGLKVILSPDHTAPIVTVAVYYNIGFRIEPKDRTGFAHLFEHMMFQGSQNLGKMEFIRLIQKNGGVLNGSTRFDYTNYFEILPSHKLETALWAEADRMRGLDITQENLTNQQGVVSNEVKVNVFNQPYGGFPWLDMPQCANSNWYNSHNFYGELSDLQAATLTDVKEFFRTYYAPNNAALAVVGDIDVEETKNLIEKYFGNLPSVKLPEKPDISEPQQMAAKICTKIDSLANRPALAYAYHMPDRGTPEYYAMGLIDQILLQGEDSRLYDALVQKKGITQSLEGGINLLGNMFNYKGPMLWMFSFVHDTTTKRKDIESTVDSVIATLHNTKIEEITLDRALVKFRSSYYEMVGGFFGFGRADLLASFALFDDNPQMVNEIEDNMRKVTPELIQKTAKEYLLSTAQTTLVVKTKSESKGE
jgi:predicted Zn-dependent peptidase